MKQICRNNKGFALVEVILVLFGLAIITIAAYFVALRINSSNNLVPEPSSLSSSQSTSSANPLVTTSTVKTTPTSSSSKTTKSKTSSLNKTTSKPTSSPPPLPSSSCATSPPSSSSDSTYPLLKTTTFKGSTPSNLQSYGNNGGGQMGGGGYISGSNLVMKGSYLQVQGNYSGTTNPSSTPRGVIGAGFDLNPPPVSSSGGFDVCMSLSTNTWGRDLNLVLLSWPALPGSWSDGENDFFEGNPQDVLAGYKTINVHAVGCNASDPRSSNYCGHNVYQNSWPTTLADGQPHVVSARWNPSQGYSFSLDGTQFASSGPSITTPIVPHQLSIQLQDTCTCNTSDVYANIYWAAAYGYN
ncbi:MAG TPA: prepilin-type N-terminal cleavage/methylation domain-containing protein [Candidatus Saccharimonadia bacterium]|nr:prepilin-type N-terminal cleavage/methylation domain-containing protein [Candidatus Saccharimonadia bacterium]